MNYFLALGLMIAAPAFGSYTDPDTIEVPQNKGALSAEGSETLNLDDYAQDPNDSISEDESFKTAWDRRRWRGPRRALITVCETRVNSCVVDVSPGSPCHCWAPQYGAYYNGWVRLRRVLR